MKNSTISRKEFFKRLGLTAGAVVAAGIAPAFAGFATDQSLSDDKKAFLAEYEAWLSEFHEFVKKRNLDPENLENNKRLMELSAEAEKRKPTLERYMTDETFARYFESITSHITDAI